jgi:hypothetical protein
MKFIRLCRSPITPTHQSILGQLASFLVYSKNYAKGYSDMQIRVREATSNDPWGPSGTIMNEIAQATFNK